jgi:hypothetical protein
MPLVASLVQRKLTIAESKYSTFDQEILAAITAIRHFRHFLERREFQLWTDHRPLVTALTRVSEPRSARQQSHLGAIAKFTSDLRCLPRPANVIADTCHVTIGFRLSHHCSNNSPGIVSTAPGWATVLHSSVGASSIPGWYSIAPG